MTVDSPEERGGCGVADRHATHRLKAALRRPSGNLFFDIRSVALMREHGVREIYTADAGFKLFSGIKALNPIRD